MSESRKIEVPVWLAVVLGVAPTGGLGGVAKMVSAQTDKIDAIASRLDKIEGADIGRRVDDHETRMRKVEGRLERLEVLQEKH